MFSRSLGHQEIRWIVVNRAKASEFYLEVLNIMI